MAERQGYLRNVSVTPGLLRRGFNVWPPFLAAGIRVERIADDYRAIDVSVAIVDCDGEVVAEVDKTLYVRREASRA